MRTQKKAFIQTSLAMTWLLGGFLQLTLTQAAEKEAEVIQSMQIAIQAKKSAAAKTEALLPKMVGTDRYQPALEKLSALYFEALQLQGELAALKRTNVQRDVFLLSKVIQFSSQVVQNSRSPVSVTRMLLLRGQAYKEMNQWQNAAEDFKKIISMQPRSEDAISAAIIAYDMLIERREYAVALMLIEQLQLEPSHSHYLLTREYLADLQYRLGDFSKAVKTVENSLDLESKRTENKFSSKYSVHRKAAFQTLAQALASGIEKKEPGFEISSVLQIYQKYGKSSELPKLISDFALQLRVRNLVESMELLAKTLPSLTFPKHATLAAQILSELTIMEYYGKKENLPLLDASISRLQEDLRSIRSLSADKTLETTVLKQTKSLLPLMIASVRSVKNPDLKILAKVYECALMLPEENGAYSLSLHLDLAQIYESIEAHALAAQHYGWIVKNRELASKLNAQKQALVSNAFLKTILNRYFQLKNEKRIPEKVVAVQFDQFKAIELSPGQKEWIEWVNSAPTMENSKELQTMIFEKNRMLYAMGYFKDAIVGFQNMIKNYPRSSYVAPGLLLVMDTYIINRKWEPALQLSISSKKNILNLDPKVKASLEESGALAYLGILDTQFKNRNYQEVIQGTDQALIAFPNTKYRNELLTLAGHSALGKADAGLARGYFSKLDRKIARIEQLQAADLTDATVLETQSNYAEALSKYLSYLKSKPDPEIRKKAIVLASLTGRSSDLTLVFRSPEVCRGSSQEADCNLLLALIHLLGAPKDLGGTSFQEKLRQWKANPALNQPIWAASLLNEWDKLSWEDRALAIQHAVNGINAIEFPTKMVLLQRLSVTVPNALNFALKLLPRIAAVKVSKTAIAKRVELIKILENSLKAIDPTSWAHFKTQALLTSARMYQDLSREIKSLPAPSGLTSADVKTFKNTLNELALPFDSNAVSYAEETFAYASDQGVASDLIEQVLRTYNEIKPGVWNSINKNRSVYKGKDAISSLLNLDIKIFKDSSDLWKNWRKAIKDRELQRATYLALVGKTQAGVSETDLKLAQAIALMSAGAVTEAFILISQVIEEADKSVTLEACNLYVSNSYLSFSKEQTSKRLKFCDSRKSDMDIDLVRSIELWLSEGGASG